MTYLVGEKVYLRGVTEEDAGGEYLDWMNDHEVMKWTNTGRLPVTQESAKQYVKSMQSSPDNVFMAIVRIEDNRHIGNFHAKIDWVNRTAVTGRIMSRDCWGKGYGTEASVLFINYLFNRLNLNRVSSGTAANNQKALRMWEKLGYKIEGRLRQAIFIDGEYQDVIQGAVLREDWEERSVAHE